ncbi:MAG: hypothetical protein ACRDRP_21995 [Pseudonocardiaceae bacterium]
MDGLVALAGWTPALTEAQASRLAEAATGGGSREQFAAVSLLKLASASGGTTRWRGRLKSLAAHPG